MYIILCYVIIIKNACRLLHDILLPKNNTMPESRQAAKSILRSLGLDYNVYHACVNDCTLFRGNLVNEEKCPDCGERRYKENGTSNTG